MRIYKLMKNLTTCLLFTILMLAFSVSAFGESYLCIPDKATGFGFEVGEWSSTDFNVDNEKYILREQTPKEIERMKEGIGFTKELVNELDKEGTMSLKDLGLGWDASAEYVLNSTHVVREHGVDNFPLYFCRYVPITGSFICFGVNKGEFLFSTKSGRFMMTYPVGYWRGKDNDQTPAMYIGRCSKI